MTTVQDFLNSTRRSVAHFREMQQAGTLEMKPPFQRNPVWTLRQKSFLIDTILCGYPVPEIYMEEHVDETGRQRHVVVDGQQRLRACLEFIEGSFSLVDVSNDAWQDANFDDLQPEEKKSIFGYSFIVRQLPEMPEPQLREIFTRLNRNTVALNKQELRHATYWGPFIRSMEQIADNDFWSASGIFTANDVRRMLDIEYVSELAIGLLHGPQNKKAALDRWYQIYEDSFEERSRVEQVFGTVLHEIGKMLPNIHETRWRKKSDFYTLFLVLASHAENLPLRKLDRESARMILIDFGAAVSSYITEGGPKQRDVGAYARAVEKAASDLNSRRKRAEVLDGRLAPVFG